MHKGKRPWVELQWFRHFKEDQVTGGWPMEGMTIYNWWSCLNYECLWEAICNKHAHLWECGCSTRALVSLCTEVYNQELYYCVYATCLLLSRSIPCQLLPAPKNQSPIKKHMLQSAGDIKETTTLALKGVCHNDM